MTNQTSSSPPPPGWYPDDNGVTRYWDGNAWTDQVQPAAGPADSGGAAAGAPTVVAPAPVIVTTKSSNGLATAGFVLGLLGFLGAWIPFINFLGIILGVIGLILAAIGLAKANKLQAGKGLAIAGVVLGVLAVVIAISINVAFVGAVDEAVKETTRTDVQVPGSGSGDPADSGSSNSDGDIGTTRANPAPLGSAISGDDWTVTVNSVTTTRSDSLGRTADSGKVLLVVNLTATYNGDDEQGETAWTTVKYVATDGTTVSSTDGFYSAEDSFDLMKTVYSGGSITGDEILQVPEDWQDGVLAVSPGIFKDDTFVTVK